MLYVYLTGGTGGSGSESSLGLGLGGDDDNDDDDVAVDERADPVVNGRIFRLTDGPVFNFIEARNCLKVNGQPEIC